MYKEAEYVERCKARGLDEAGVAAALGRVRALEKEAAGPHGTLKGVGLAAVEKHVTSLAAAGGEDEAGVMALARYFAVLGEDAITIRLLAYLLPVGVLPAMAERLETLEGKAARERVMRGVTVPPVGAAPEDYPAGTAAFTKALEAELGAAKAHRVLAWNVHGIPAAAYAEERERYLEAASVDEWLLGFHERKVATLARHAADGTLWFEQKITPAVVDFVRDNPEILGGVRKGDTLYVTKIPYDPDRYLKSGDRLERRRLACHCPLAASSITAEGAGVPSLWCSCSAGYEKFIFDTVFGVELEAEVLASALAGDELCRYALRLPPSVKR